MIEISKTIIIKLILLKTEQYLGMNHADMLLSDWKSEPCVSQRYKELGDRPKNIVSSKYGSFIDVILFLVIKFTYFVTFNKI